MTLWKTNLLIFLTPRVIRDQFDARDVTLNNRDSLADVIASTEVGPSRDEVLRNPALDRVSHAEQFRGEKPSTVFVPQVNQEEETTPPPSLLKNKALSLKVAPELPKLPEVTSEATADKKASLQVPTETETDTTISLPDLSKKQTPAPSDTAKVVVLDLGKAQELEQSIPFYKPGKQRYIALEIPLSSNALAINFFQPGQKYSFEGVTAPLEFENIGSFSNLESARKMFPELEDRYQLSPYEIINLGKGPWLKK